MLKKKIRLWHLCEIVGSFAFVTMNDHEEERSLYASFTHDDMSDGVFET